MSNDHNLVRRHTVTRSMLFLTLMVLHACTIHDPEAPGLLVPATVDEDATLPSIQVRDTALHIRTFGDPSNPKLFVLEGGPGNDFRYMLGLTKEVNGRSLSDDFYIIFHDYRSSGLSRRHDIADITMNDMRKDLEALIDHYAPGENIYLLGHSHGGIVAAQYLEHHAKRVQGLILMESGALSAKILSQQHEWVSIDYLSKGLHDVTWLRQSLGADGHASTDYWITVARESIGQSQRGDTKKDRGKTWRYGAAAMLAIPLGEMAKSEYDYTKGASTYKNPTLMISSTLSEDLGYDFQHKHHEHLFSNVKHVQIEDTGHTGIVVSSIDKSLTYIFAYLDEVRP